MATKNNIRSIRISDEILEAIEAQAGRNFTEKFERLITRCIFELPEIEKRLQGMKAEIEAKREELQKFYKLKQDLYGIELKAGNMLKDLNEMSNRITVAQETIENVTQN